MLGNSQNWRVGDWVIYRKSKHGVAPGPRAQRILPSKAGESYNYTVDKYWIVSGIRSDGSLTVRTLRGKEHHLPADDTALRKPFFWERWLLRRRFRDVEQSLNLPSNGDTGIPVE